MRLILLSVLFCLFGLSSQAQNNVTTTSSDSTVYEAHTVTKAPLFKGADRNTFNDLLKTRLQDFISTNKLNDKGFLVMTVIIEKDGSIKNIKLLKGVSEEVNNKAIAIIKESSGNWTGASQNGNPIRCQFSIGFKI